jgi:hypothetical protein
MKRAGGSLAYSSAIGIALLAATGVASAQSATGPSAADKPGAPAEQGPGPASGGGVGPGFMMGPGMMRGAGMWRGRFCDPRVAGMAEWRIDEIERMVRPTDAQRTALGDLRTASVKARDALKSACPVEIPHTSAQRMAFMEKRMEAMLEAIKIVRPAFDALYAAMNDEQKARLDAVGPHRWGWRWRWHG